MNTVNISQKAKNKHLNFSHYEFIINSLIQFNASHPGKRNTGKTQFIKELASTVGTTVSNIYSIIKDATISVRDYNLKVHYELSAMAAFEKRSKNHKIPNNSKFEKIKRVHLGSLTVVSNFSLTKSLKTLIISMLLSFFIVKFVKIIVLTWANVCYNGHRR